jgi:chromosome segregation ATPase
MALTLDRVRDIVLDCLRRGEAPSQRAVRKALGGGSPNEIGPLVREVMLELSGRPSTVSTLPASLTQATEALWQLALAQAHQMLDTEREQAQLAVVSWKTQADHFSALAEARAAELQAAAVEAEKRYAEHVTASANWQHQLAQKGEIERTLQQQLQALNSDREALRRDLFKCQSTTKQLHDENERMTASLNTQHAQLEQRAIALAESRGAMSQAQARLAELVAALAYEQMRCQQLLIEAAAHSVQQQQLREQLDVAAQQQATLQLAISAAQAEITGGRHLAQTLDAIATLAQVVPSKANQPARLRIDGVAAQIELARLLATRTAP